MKAKDILTTSLACIAPSTKVNEIVRLLPSRHVSALPPVDDANGLRGFWARAARRRVKYPRRAFPSGPSQEASVNDFRGSLHCVARDYRPRTARFFEGPYEMVVATSSRRPIDA